MGKQIKHDGKPVPPPLWGRDHMSTLLYVETRVVDNGGTVGAAHMRTANGRPRRGMRGPQPLGNGKEYPTRLADSSELSGHDDWDCVEDFVEAGLVIWEGTGLNPILKLTDRGWEIAQKLRRMRAEKTKMTSLQDIMGVAS